jgi:hypothetical protein
MAAVSKDGANRTPLLCCKSRYPCNARIAFVQFGAVSSLGGTVRFVGFPHAAHLRRPAKHHGARRCAVCRSIAAILSGKPTVAGGGRTAHVAGSEWTLTRRGVESPAGWAPLTSHRLCNRCLVVGGRYQQSRQSRSEDGHASTHRQKDSFCEASM